MKNKQKTHRKRRENADNTQEAQEKHPENTLTENKHKTQRDTQKAQKKSTHAHTYTNKH